MRKLFSLLFTVLLCILIGGCAGEPAESEDRVRGEAMDLKYADQFAVETYEDGSSIITIQDGLSYLLLPPGQDIPEWIGEEKTEYTIIRQPLESVYLAASSAMDLIDSIGSISSVTMTSTKASDWSIESIRALVENEDIVYIGKYSAPDYEALLESECDLTIESTMIYHSPEIKETIESLGIPVMVERSSYETHPLGRLEWIKLYGLLLGKEEEANAFFEDTVSRLDLILAETEKKSSEDRPKVAFFSIGSNGYATVRKPGDYICQMIEMAGGEYALNGIDLDEENALSTANIQLESFYEYAVNSDIMIYNSAIQEEIFSVDQLLDKFPELKNTKAVQEGNVWCTGKSVFQKSSGICGMTEELYQIISGTATEKTELEYYHKLENSNG